MDAFKAIVTLLESVGSSGIACMILASFVIAEAMYIRGLIQDKNEVNDKVFSMMERKIETEVLHTRTLEDQNKLIQVLTSKLRSDNAEESRLPV